MYPCANFLNNQTNVFPKIARMDLRRTPSVPLGQLHIEDALKKKDIVKFKSIVSKKNYIEMFHQLCHNLEQLYHNSAAYITNHFN